MAAGEIITDLFNRSLGLDKDGNLILKTGGAPAWGSTPVALTATPAQLNALALQIGGNAVAAAGSGQSTYTALTASINAVTGADGTVGVALPAATTALAPILIINTSTTAVLKVAPVNGGNDQINSLTASTGVFSMAPGQAIWFVATSSTQWYTPFAWGQTPGTASAYLPALLGANKNLDVLVLPDSGLFLGSGAGTAVDATALEINRVAQVSTRVVSLSSSTAITAAAHDGRTILMGGAGSARTFTLPTPVVGMKFKFVVGAVNTSNYLIKSVSGAHVIGGTIMTLSDNSAAVLGYTAGATDDTITLNGTTTGGVTIGDWIELEAMTTTRWVVRGQTTSSGTEATPFSDTVA